MTTQNIFQTPLTTAWTTPSLTAGVHPRLVPASFLTRFPTNWALTTGGWPALKKIWNTTSNNPTVTPLVVFLATGSASALTSAYNNAINESYNVLGGANQDSNNYVDLAVWVFDLCYSHLTSTQRTNLINKIESNNASRETTLNASNTLFPFGEFEQGSPAYVAGVLAINGEPGATNRLTNARNLIQNLSDWRDEVGADGHCWAYAWEAARIPMLHNWWTNAVGATSPSKYYQNRGRMVVRELMGDGLHAYANPSDQRADTTGAVHYLTPETGFQMAALASTLGDPVVQGIANNMIAAGFWSQFDEQPIGKPTWMAFGYYNSSLSAQTPVQAAMPACASFPTNGIVEFRGGWNAATDIIARFFCNNAATLDHDVRTAGHFEVRRGDNMLVCSVYNYAGRNSGWEIAPALSNPQLPGNASWTKNCPSYVPSGSSTEDSSGAQRNTGTTFGTIGTAFNYPTWAGGTINSFSDDGSLALMTGDISGSYSQVSTAKVTCGYKRGQDSKHGTFVIIDSWTGGTLGNIRRPFGARGPWQHSGSIAVKSGSSSAGVLALTGTNSIFYDNGKDRVTVQLVSPMSQIDLVGGAGYESWHDGYPSGGSNTDFKVNFQGGVNDNRNATCYARIQGCWQARFRTTQALATNNRMTYVVTVGDTGVAAQSYTEAQAMTLIQSAPPPASPLIFAGNGVIANTAHAGTVMVNQDIPAGSVVIFAGKTANTANTALTVLGDSVNGNVWTIHRNNIASIPEVNYGSYITPVKIPSGSTINATFGTVNAAHGMVVGFCPNMGGGFDLEGNAPTGTSQTALTSGNNCHTGTRATSGELVVGFIANTIAIGQIVGDNGFAFCGQSPGADTIAMCSLIAPNTTDVQFDCHWQNSANFRAVVSAWKAGVFVPTGEDVNVNMDDSLAGADSGDNF